MASKKKQTKKAATKKSRAKPDAIELFTHEGRLAEAMRAGGFKMSSKAFAAAVMDLALQGHEGADIRIVDGARVYSSQGKEFATIALEGEKLVLRFLAPKKKPDDFASVERFYRSVAGRPGWLEYRRPATRDRRPDQDAKLGDLLVQVGLDRRGGRPSR